MVFGIDRTIGKNPVSVMLALYNRFLLSLKVSAHFQGHLLFL